MGPTMVQVESSSSGTPRVGLFLPVFDPRDEFTSVEREDYYTVLYLSVVDDVLGLFLKHFGSSTYCMVLRNFTSNPLTHS